MGGGGGSPPNHVYMCCLQSITTPIREGRVCGCHLLSVTCFPNLVAGFAQYD